MEESTKETVIIVHGTWAGLEPETTRWYQPVDGVPAAEGLVVKLDDALQERGSPARCWAHCTQGNQIFQWSGKNSWTERTHAALALGDYVATLRNEGWRCHIVAHSHGGNVVVEAMPLIIAAPKSNGPPGTVVTLGTPFIDTKLPILRARKHRFAVANGINLTIALFLTLLCFYLSYRGMGDRDLIGVFGVMIVTLLLLFVRAPGIWAIHWSHRQGAQPGEIHRVAGTEPKFSTQRALFAASCRRSLPTAQAT